MKKIILLLAILVFTLPVFAFEIPAGKKINIDAVENGILTYSKK